MIADRLAQLSTLPEGDALTLQQLIDGIPDPMFFKDRQHRWIAFNQAFCDMLGRTRKELFRRSDPDFFPSEQVAMFWHRDEQVFATGKGDLSEELITGAGGVQRVFSTRKTPVRDASGAIVGLSGIIMDISEQRELTRKAAALEAEAAWRLSLIEAQERLIDDLVVPVLEVWEGILLLPLVGGLTQGRAATVVEGALAAVSERATDIVIIDVTAAGSIDTEMAELLVRTVRAIRFVGCRSIVVGLSPTSAQALAEGGAGLGGMITCGTLKQGLSLALAKRRK